MMYTPSARGEVNIDVLYVDSLRACGRCGMATNKFYYESKAAENILCPNCKYALFPPQITLQILVNNVFKNGKLYNPYTKCYEHTFGITDFIECGWFVRRRIVYDMNTHIHGQNRFFARNGAQWTNWVKEIVQLEYYGNCLCKRVPNYRFFPDHAETCLCVYCKKSTH